MMSGVGSGLCTVTINADIITSTEKADNALSKINTDYETSLYAAMASFIIHI